LVWQKEGDGLGVLIVKIVEHLSLERLGTFVAAFVLYRGRDGVGASPAVCEQNGKYLFTKYAAFE
jgi:hypothetical protein